MSRIRKLIANKIMAGQNSLQKKLQGRSEHGRNSDYSNDMVRVVPGFFAGDHKKSGVKNTLPSHHGPVSPEGCSLPAVFSSAGC